MKQEQDRELGRLLSCYRVAVPDTQAHNALLDRIVAAASAVPQDRAPLFSSRTFSSRPRSLRNWAQGWTADAAALAAVALLGFWIGNASLMTTSSVKTVSTQATYSASADYLNRIVFGPKSLNEVSL